MAATVLETRLPCDAIDVRPLDGALAISTSALTTEILDGEVVLCDKNGAQPRVLRNDCGVAAARWHGLDSVLGAGDDGVLPLWGPVSSPAAASAAPWGHAEHDDAATALSVAADGSVLSASCDGTVRLWPALREPSKRTYSDHVAAVWDVQWNTSDANGFASASQDKTVLLWDQRIARSVSAISGQFAFFAISWSTSGSFLACGDEDGFLTVYDVRKIAEPLYHNRDHEWAVRCVAFRPGSDTLVASAGDDNAVKVTSIEKRAATYKSEDHKDFARSVAWSTPEPEFLYSVGWDCKVLKHTIPK
eukprot:m51a1_g1260 hypothetical protein (304) ;mRNA; r:50117-51460